MWVKHTQRIEPEIAIDRGSTFEITITFSPDLKILLSYEEARRLCQKLEIALAINGVEDGE